MIIFEKLHQIKEMITQLFVYQTIIISKTMISIDLSKQQVLDGDPNAIQQISFTGNLAIQSTTYFINEEAKETVLDFSQKKIKVF